MESTKRSSSLRTKVIAIVLFGALLQYGAIMYIVYYFYNKGLSESLVDRGRIIAESIEEQVATPMIEDDAVALKKVVEKYRNQNNNEYIIIVDDAFELIADTYDGNIPAILMDPVVYQDYDPMGLEQYKVTPLQVNGASVYDIRMPIKQGLLGMVRVGLNRASVDMQVKKTVIYIGLVVIAGLIFAMALAIWAISSQVTRPVSQLITAAKEISLGNFNAPVQISVNNELMELAEAIDRMKESLKTSLERLKTRSTIGRF